MSTFNKERITNAVERQQLERQKVANFLFDIKFKDALMSPYKIRAAKNYIDKLIGIVLENSNKDQNALIEIIESSEEFIKIRGIVENDFKPDIARDILSKTGNIIDYVKRKLAN